MMLALLAAFQLAAAAGASTGARTLVVKDASRSVSVPLTASSQGPMVRAEQLRPIVPVTVSHVTGDRWMLIVGGSAIEVEDGVRFARVGDDQFQLARAPEVRRGALYVPLQLVVELIPRVAGNLAWDPERFELRAFSAVVRNEDRVAVQQGRAVAPSPRRDDDDLRVAERTPPVALATSAVESVGLRSRRLVVVDAGHGGDDPGMRGPLSGGPRVTEKAVTLAVAKRVGAALNRRGIDVKYTRTTDTLIALSRSASVRRSTGVVSTSSTLARRIR